MLNLNHLCLFVKGENYGRFGKKRRPSGFKGEGCKVHPALVYRYLGFLQSFAITIRELEGALEEGMGFDGSSIVGFVRIDESDMVAKPEDPVERNVYEMTEKERKKNKIESLPGNLYEAIHTAEKSDLVRRALGDHVFYQFIENKKIEWERYCARVTDYELDQYFSIL